MYFLRVVNENIFSYIGCSNCVDRMKYLDYDVAIRIYGLVGNNDYPKHRDIILNVLSGFSSNFRIKNIYCNVYENDVYMYEYAFYVKYTELYNKEKHDTFEEVYNHYFIEDKMKEFKTFIN